MPSTQQPSYSETATAYFCTLTHKGAPIAETCRHKSMSAAVLDGYRLESTLKDVVPALRNLALTVDVHTAFLPQRPPMIEDALYESTLDIQDAIHVAIGSSLTCVPPE